MTFMKNNYEKYGWPTLANVKISVEDRDIVCEMFSLYIGIFMFNIDMIEHNSIS